jgi:putative transposase
MSRFRKLSHAIWHCQYHLVWVPKYRYRVLTGRVAEAVSRCLRAFSEQQKAEVVELNIQVDHVHLLVMIPPNVSVSDYVGTVKGRTAIRVFNKFRERKRRPDWGNYLCAERQRLDQ